MDKAIDMNDVEASKKGVNDWLSAQRNTVEGSLDKIANLAGVSGDLGAVRHLLARIPATVDHTASGFDAGVAVATGLIPEEYAGLSAKLHLKQTPEAIMELRTGIEQLRQGAVENSTLYWALASAFCIEDNLVDGGGYLHQVSGYEKVRKTGNVEQMRDMALSFINKLGERSAPDPDGVYAAGDSAGCLGAYAIHKAAVAYYTDARYPGMFFIGTYHDSLGLDNFEFGKRLDKNGAERSGKIGGRSNFVKCDGYAEFGRAMNLVKSYFNSFTS